MKLRVAIVAPNLRILGGQAIQADRLLQHWRQDTEVEAWLVPVNPVPPGPLRRATQVKYLRTVATELTYVPLLARELRRADIVHVFSASYASFLLAPLPAIAIARAYGKPVVLNYHSGEAPDHLRKSAIARKVLARVDRNVVQSRFLHDVFAGFGLDAAIVPNTLDLERFGFRRRHRLQPRLLSTRNFEPNYNVACTLRAFRLVQQRHADATLTLVGFGSQEQRLRDLTRELGLRGVTFVGRVSPADIVAHYDAADIFVQTPDVDNMPLSLLEAFACGLPSVSTAVGGVPAILRNGTDGLLADRDDYVGVARQVLRLLDDPPLAGRLADSARRSCEPYAWSTVREQWLDLYRSVSDGSRLPAVRAAADGRDARFTVAGSTARRG